MRPALAPLLPQPASNIAAATKILILSIFDPYTTPLNLDKIRYTSFTKHSEQPNYPFMVILKSY